MRTAGSKTLKNCFNLSIVVNNQEIYNNDFKTLKEISEELGFTYNKVIEIKRNRRKQLTGRYEPQYYINKIGKEDVEEGNE